MTFVKTALFHKAGEGSGGGGDQHNLGYYETPEALRTAHPTATAGDFALVNSTDTVWLWDADTSTWKDGDTKGQVTSVNNQTGAVTLTASDVGALPDNTHIPADPVQADWDEADSTALDYIKNKPSIPAAQVNSDWNANSGVAQILNKPTIPDAIQTDTMPTAAVGELGKVYQFIGTTDANYTHGYFYECVSDGQNPATYSWSNVQVQASSGGLPSQTGNAGKFLTTDGTDASWSDKPLVNNATGSESLSILTTKNLTNSYSVSIGYNADASVYSVIIGRYAGSYIIGQNQTGYGCVLIGYSTGSKGNYSVAVGYQARTDGGNAVAIGSQARANALYAIQLGGTNTSNANNDANTFKVGNGNGNFEMMSADGTIPTDRYTTTPSADGTYVPTLTISSGVATRSWSAPSGGAPTTATVTLAVNDWSSNTQTVNVTGVTASNTVFVAPAPASNADYVAGGIVCTAQGAGTLEFTCTTTPSSAITVNVCIFG